MRVSFALAESLVDQLSYDSPVVVPSSWACRLSLASSGCGRRMVILGLIRGVVFMWVAIQQTRGGRKQKMQIHLPITYYT
jgi:hypothetical protein